MPDYVLFPSLRDLIQALSLCWTSDLFPEKIVKTSPFAGYAAPAAGFKDLDRSARQHGWVCSAENRVVGAETPLASLLGATWTYSDPLRHNGTREYHLGTSTPTYLLGARNETEAQGLLTTLTREFVDGIRIVPVVLSQPHKPFEFFWLLPSGHVPLDALRAAPRAWWGPAGQSRNAVVLLEWPYSVDLPNDFLQRVPWGAGGGYVLLSKSEPSVLIVQSDEEPSASWESFGDFRPVNVQATRSVGEHSRVRFPVDLQFTRSDTLLDPSERINRLEQEIEIRQLQLAVLREELGLRASREPEPLLLYYSESDSEVPRDLRRLLIEWSDQPGSLDALVYVKLDCAGFPAGLDQPYPAVHVITTAHALGLNWTSNSDPTLGRRLLDYTPGIGARPRFDLLAEWVPDLRVFIPHGEGLSLYPHLRPGKAAAEKFGDALFGPHVGADERRQSIVLLVEGERRRVSACHIDRRKFRPLVSAVEWECAIDVAPAGLYVSQAVEAAGGEALVDGIVASFYNAARKDGTARLDKKKIELEEEVASETVRINRREQEIGKLHDSANRLENLLSTLHTELLQLAPDVRSVVDLIQSTAGQARRLSGIATALNTARDKFMAAAKRLSVLEDDVERLRTEAGLVKR